MSVGSFVGIRSSGERTRARFGGAAAAAAAAASDGSGGGSGSNKSFLRKTVEFLQAATFFIVVAVAAFALSYGILSQTFRMGQRYNENDYQALEGARISATSSVILPDAVARDWTVNTKLIHVVDRKTGSVAMADSVIGDPADHILLGLYERDRTNRKREAGLHFYLAASNGHPDATRLYKDLNIPTEDYEELYQQFIALHEMNGDLGLLRLGQYYLGADAFRLARRMRSRLRYDEPNDYLWPQQNDAQNLAYTYFHMSSLCGLTSGYEWRAETANYYKFTQQRENALRQRANAQLKQLADRFGGDQDAYCGRTLLSEAIEQIRDEYRSRAVVRYEAELSGWDGRENPCELGVAEFTDEECDEFDAVIRSGYFGSAANLPTFGELIDRIVGVYVDRKRVFPGRRIEPGRGRGGSGSQAYRNAPGAASVENIAPRAPDGLPDDCIDLDAGEECSEREPALTCADLSKYHFKRGEADMAVGRVARARSKFNRALAVGRACQSEYAELAGKRLAALNLTCEYSPESLARISRDYDASADGGALIDLASRQRALASKGYYEGDIDGRYGPGTRDATRLFQREIGFSETGDLTPIETVYLICSAAQVNADPKSMNLLGVMYIAGLGVVQNTDAGIRFLKFAAQRGDADAKFNLALIYGTGTVISSYRLCDLVENIQQADAYLTEAANAGNRPAQRLIELFGPLPPSERWEKIKEELELNEFYAARLEPVGEGCRPN
ncbi:MAG: hypothetical protein GC152_13580 [Alphaproteobacteria bacterium]|nr:hypothetical protein [Alphaproteobacteria bacterium]